MALLTYLAVKLMFDKLDIEDPYVRSGLIGFGISLVGLAGAGVVAGRMARASRVAVTAEETAADELGALTSGSRQKLYPHFQFNKEALPTNRNSLEFQQATASQLGVDLDKINSGKIAILHRRLGQQELLGKLDLTKRDIGTWGSKEQGIGLAEYVSGADRGYLKPAPSVVRITLTNAEGTEASAVGSGVIVTKGGRVVTNEHVVRGADFLKVETHDGRSFAASVLDTNPGQDLALLQLNSVPEGMKFSPVALANATDLQLGTRVAAVGHHGGMFGLVASPGQFTAARSRFFPGASEFQLDSVVSGSSGAGIFNYRGRLMGLVSRDHKPIPQTITGPSVESIRKIIAEN